MVKPPDPDATRTTASPLQEVATHVGVGEYLNLAWERANRSLDEARGLQTAGFHGAAFVWAVRAAEVFTREFLLMPLFIDEENGIEGALRRARKVFGSGNWLKAYARLEEYVGPIDMMLTDTNEDAWRHWNRHASDTRGNVVHGNAEITSDLADWAIAYASQLFTQMVMRIVVSGKHPASDPFMKVVEDPRTTFKRNAAGEP